MQKPDNPPSQGPEPQHPESVKWGPINKAAQTQLSLQIRRLDGSRHTWPYSRLHFHVLEGGTLTIWFTEHVVIIRGRHLEEADDGLRLQSLVGLLESGTRRKDVLGEEEIPEDQPAIDWIDINNRNEK